MRRSVLVTLLLATAAYGHEDTSLEGQIFAVDGLPMPGVTVAVGGVAAPTKTTSDGAGRYRLEFEHDGNRPQALFAIDAAQRWGAIAPLGSATKTAGGHLALDMTLEPLVLVRGRLDWQPVYGEVPKTRLRVRVLPSGARISSTTNDDGAFRFLLPPGRYRLDARAEGEHPDWTKTIVVADLARDFGRIEVSSTLLTEFYGVVPPEWTVTAARNAPPDVSLKTYAGKWVVLVFWDASDPATVGKALPGLTTFYNDFAAQRDRFEIVALHGPPVSSFESLDARAAMARTLPYPVLIDGLGATAKAYGIDHMPRLLLLDPEGRLVRGGSLSTLADSLKR